MKSFSTTLVVLVVFYIASSFTVEPAPKTDTNNCPESVAINDIVIAQEVTIAAIGEIYSGQSILEGSNVMYKSGSGTILSTAALTGSLVGASPNFQVFPGSTLTIEIENCISNSQ